MEDPDRRPPEPRAIDVENPAEIEQLAEELEATAAEIVEAVRMGYTNRTALELYFAAPQA